MSEGKWTEPQREDTKEKKLAEDETGRDNRSTIWRSKKKFKGEEEGGTCSAHYRLGREKTNSYLWGEGGKEGGEGAHGTKKFLQFKGKDE